MTMRACIVKSFGSPEVLQILSDVAKPTINGSKQVLVKVMASGLNPVDTYIRSGVYPKLPELPFCPGKDGAGIVEEIGSSVSHVKKGDRVWFAMSSTGSAAEYCIAEMVVPLPDSIDFSAGASVGVPYMTAYRSLFLRGLAKTGETVLIHGASGGVGLAACQLAAWKGIHAVGTAGTAAGLKLVTENGARDVFNHRDADYLEKMKQKYPKGFDLILEMAAHINLGNDLGLLGHNGRVAVIGNRGEVTINPRLLMSQECQVFGVALAMSTPEEFAEMGKEITAFFNESGKKPVVHKEYSLDHIASAHHDIINNQGAMGNLVIKL